jgi:hypothetical protein
MLTWHNIILTRIGQSLMETLVLHEGRPMAEEPKFHVPADLSTSAWRPRLQLVGTGTLQMPSTLT